MATNTVIPHFLLPRGELLFRPRVPRLSRSIYKQESNKTRPQCRFASSKNQNPKVLEKPLKFNPPSHPQRLVRSAPRQYPGPPLSSEQIEAQKTKQYPNMMPPDDTWMHWFLTNRKIHIYITLGTLSTLALTTFALDFKHNSPYGHLLPEASEYFWHPLASVKQLLEVLKMNEMHTTEVTAERRSRRLEESVKRKAYRVAHGLEPADGQGIELPASTRAAIGIGPAADKATTEASSDFVDFEGKKRPIKKWLGIW